MKRSIFFAAALTASLAPVSYFDPVRAEGPATGQASPAPSLTVREALSLAVALRNLDGHLVVVPQDGGKSSGTVMVPWEFGNGALRLRIARDLGAVAAVEQAAEQSRQAIIREILKKTGGTEIRPGTPAMDDFTKQYEQVLAAPMPDPGHLDRIKASELKLDRNEIPITVLTALCPILDRDQ